MTELVQGYLEHVPLKQLAAQFGISRQTVSNVLNREHVQRHPPALSPSNVAEAARLYRDGWSLARLGGRFGVDAETVRRYLIEAGNTMRQPWAR